MNSKGLRWHAGGLAFVTTLGLLYLGQLLYQTYAVARPLAEALRGIDGVEKVEIADSLKGRDPLVIEVALDNPANFAATYAALEKRTAGILGREPFHLVIRDHRTDELAALYHEMRFILQEAAARGNFSAMASKAQALARAAGATICLDVDADRIYIKLNKGGAALYEVIPRLRI